MALCNGRAAAGAGLVLRTHLEACARCRDRLRLLDEVGGLLLEDAEPAPLAADAFARNLALIAEAERLDGAPEGLSVHAPPTLPEGVRWPAPLLQCRATPWRWMSRGIRWSRLTPPGAPEDAVLVLRVAAGRRLPRHTHGGVELTQVLHGHFHDGRALFGPGDLATADATLHHEPRAQEGRECICAISIEGGLRFEGAIARAFAAVTGL